MLSEDLKELGQNLAQLSEMKIEVLRQTLPSKEETLSILDNAQKQDKPKHLTDTQWQKWLDTGNKIRQFFVRSY